MEVARVRGALKVIDADTRRHANDRHKALKLAKAECASDLKAVKERFHDLTGRALAVQRALDSTSKRQRRRAVTLNRATEELQGYQRFRALLNQSGAAWEKFFKRTQQNVQTVLRLLNKAESQLDSIKADYKKAALIQLPSSYTTSFTEIKSEFENTFDNLEGLRPVISSLLEIMNTAAHVSHAQARHSIRSLLRHLRERLQDRLSELEEENEHQIGLYDQLVKLFDDAVKRSSIVVKNLTEAVQRNSKVIANLAKGVNGAHLLAESARVVVDLRAQECRGYVRDNQRADIRTKAVLDVVSNLQDVLADRWSTLHGFFLQQFESEDN